MIPVGSTDSNIVFETLAGFLVELQMNTSFSQQRSLAAPAFISLWVRDDGWKVRFLPGDSLASGKAKWLPIFLCGHVFHRG